MTRIRRGVPSRSLRRLRASRWEAVLEEALASQALAAESESLAADATRQRRASAARYPEDVQSLFSKQRQIQQLSHFGFPIVAVPVSFEGVLGTL